MLTVVYIDFFGLFGAPKMEKRNIWPNFDLPNLAESVFGIPKGHLSICIIPVTKGIHANKNLLLAFSEYVRSLWRQFGKPLRHRS